MQKQAKGIKLTREYFMSLGVGPFLVVDGADSKAPIFAERILAKAMRDRQWERIQSAGAGGRACELFLSREAYEWHKEHRPRK